MKSFKLFILCVMLGGLLAALGSMVGNRFGQTGLMMGGIFGGILGAIASVRIAVQRNWITAGQFTFTSIGAAVGFVAAAYAATHTLSSPIGPMLSAILIGVGAVAGARIKQPIT